MLATTSTYDAVMSLEDDDYADEDFNPSHAIQTIINAGQWALQGSYGRTMMAAIDAGDCLLGHASARDYWGNYIPSRHEVQQGTKGSFDYVVAANGLDYAEELAGIGLTAENAG